MQYYTPDKGTVKTVGFWRRTGSEEGKHGEIGRKNDGQAFWDAHEIIYTDCLEKGKTITGAYYASLLHQLSAEIEKNVLIWESSRSSSIKTMHECTPAQFRWAKIMELKFESLQQTRKHGLADNSSRWTRWSSPKQNVYFEDLPKSYFLEGSKELEKRLEKCIKLKGDCVEK